MSANVDREWRFVARDPEGRRLSGTVEAVSQEEARMILLEQSLTPVTLDTGQSELLARLRSAVDARALSVFTRQFATLTDAALPLLSAVQMLTELTSDKALSSALRRVANDINGGASLSDALRAHPNVFPPIYVNMVEAGEVGGTLSETLSRIADHMEASQALRERMVAAMIYPTVVLSVAVMAVVAILAFVVPVFADLFAAEGLALPLSTRLLLAASDLTTAYWWIFVPAAAVFVVVGRQLLRSEMGRRWLDFVALRLPILGNLARKAAVAQFTRAMASMLHSGVTLSDALLASSRIAGNTEVEDAVVAAREAIHAGSDLSSPLARASILPPLVAEMVKVGEESGRLEEMLDKLADFYEMEVRTAVDGAMKALEPAMIVVLGVILGGIVVAMYTPIFDLMTSLG